MSKKYNVYFKEDYSQILGYIMLNKPACKNYKYLGRRINGQKFIYDPEIHILVEFNLFETADPSSSSSNECNNLTSEECSIWNQILKSSDWNIKNEISSCTISNPCLCTPYITCSNQHIIKLDFCGNANINGNINNLSAMKYLTYIDFDYANIVGDLNSLSKMNNLTYINFSSSSNITGDLSHLSAMNNLTTINLYSAVNIGGNLNNLINMSKLYKIDLTSAARGQDWGINGTLQDISSIVTRMDYSNCNISLEQDTFNKVNPELSNNCNFI